MFIVVGREAVRRDDGCASLALLAGLVVVGVLAAVWTHAALIVMVAVDTLGLAAIVVVVWHQHHHDRRRHAHVRVGPLRVMVPAIRPSGRPHVHPHVADEIEATVRDALVWREIAPSMTATADDPVGVP